MEVKAGYVGKLLILNFQISILPHVAYSIVDNLSNIIKQTIPILIFFYIKSYICLKNTHTLGLLFTKISKTPLQSTKPMVHAISYMAVI